MDGGHKCSHNGQFSISREPVKRDQQILGSGSGNRTDPRHFHVLFFTRPFQSGHGPARQMVLVAGLHTGNAAVPSPGSTGEGAPTGIHKGWTWVSQFKIKGNGAPSELGRYVELC